jgi:hypothetical protein
VVTTHTPEQIEQLAASGHLENLAAFEDRMAADNERGAASFDESDGRHQGCLALARDSRIRALALRSLAEGMRREAVAPVAPKLKWKQGVHTTTDDDNGPMEGVPRDLLAWRAGGYTIIRQEGPDGRYILTGRRNGIGLAVPNLADAMAAAEADCAPAPSYAEGRRYGLEEAAQLVEGRAPKTSGPEWGMLSEAGRREWAAEAGRCYYLAAAIRKLEEA